jgi:hypothetical protein
MNDRRDATIAKMRIKSIHLSHDNCTVHDVDS